MGIALEVYRTCRQELRKHGGGRLEEVRLAVGELAAVEPELIEFAWQAVVAETTDVGATLAITWCPAKQYCATCAEPKARSRGSWLRLCPDCEAPLRVEGGDELDVMQITFASEQEGDDEAGS